MNALALLVGMLAIGPTLSESGQANDKIALETLAASQRQSLAEIDKEWVALLVNKAKIDNSKPLKIEEAKSLRLRFPGVIVEDSFNASQFIAALKLERQRKLTELTTTLRSLNTIYRAKSCADLIALRGQVAELYSNTGWTKLELRERILIRDAIETLINEAEKAGDPCSPYQEPDADKNMGRDPDMDRDLDMNK